MTNAQNGEYEKVQTDEKSGNNETEEIPPYGYGVRHIQVILMFVSMSIGFMSRGHLSVSIVAMTYPPKPENVTELRTENININISMENNTELLYTTERILEDIATYNISDNVSNTAEVNETNMLNYNKKDYNNTMIGNGTLELINETRSVWNVNRRYNWEKSVREMVLSSFFLGYSIMMFPIGVVCQKWGGKLPLQVALAVSGVVSILTPWLAVWGGWKAVCFSRILQGMSQAGFFPATHTLLSAWVPVSERATLTSYVYTGLTFGTVIAFQIGGILADSRWGWPATFWVTGVVCLLNFLMLTIFGAATPSEHKTITEAEKKFIMGHADSGVKRKGKVPWKMVLTSKHVWAIFATHVAGGVSFIFFFTQVPTYLYYILAFDLKNSGLISSLPYVCGFLSGIGFGWLSDFFTNKKSISIKSARIISNTTAQAGQAVCLVLVSYTTSPMIAVLCFVILLTVNSGIYTGFMVNYMDLAPNYSGTVMATGNTITNACAQILPILFPNVVTDMRNQTQWRIMFFLIAGLVFTMNAIFVMFMSVEKQPWNEHGYEQADQEESEIKKKETD